MTVEPVLNIYQRKINGVILRFFEQSSFRKSHGGSIILKGFVAGHVGSQPAEMNYDKMLARGWRKIDHPLLTLRNRLRDDANKLLKADPLGMTKYPELLNQYADSLEEATKYPFIYTGEIK